MFFRLRMFKPYLSPIAGHHSGRFLRNTAAKLKVGLSPLFGFTLMASVAHAGNLDTDQGILNVVTVSNIADCQTLCSQNKLCGGMTGLQPDTSKPIIQCTLHDRVSPNSPFVIPAPTDLDPDLALAALNAYRAQYGLQSVSLNAKLSAASQSHADDLASHDTISHSGTDGSDPATRATRQNYRYRLIAENVATGQNSWEEVFKAWQESPGHNVNLLQESATEFGIALTYNPQSQYRTFWAMLMGNPL